MSAAGSPSTCALAGTPLAGARAGIDACVHCGFCLQSCPTYLALEDENDSPRGRVVLMRGLLEGTLEPQDRDVRLHIDRCLGCRACESACPSGVPYGDLLEVTRATLVEQRPLPLAARAMLAVFARRAPLRAAMVMARALRATRVASLLARLPGRVGFAFAMLDATRRPAPAPAYPVPANDARGTVALLDGCVMEGLFAETNRATARVLAVNGFGVMPAPGQQCCGALHAHAGDLVGARALARANIVAFERAGADLVAVNSAGCGAMCKSYGHLLADDPEWGARAAAMAERVRDVSELLAEAGPTAARGTPRRVTYDAPCHLLHAQRVGDPPRRVLAAVGGLDVVPLTDADQCCGGAGMYGLLQPAISAAVLAPKLRNISDTGAEYVATGNPGCLMQIGAGMKRAGIPARAIHPVDLLDAAYATDVAVGRAAVLLTDHARRPAS
ncbi:MAG: (Fe-S)-binding protein [Gemmatimonadaceae bacterium]